MEVAVGHEDEQMAADLLDDFLKLAAGFVGRDQAHQAVEPAVQIGRSCGCPVIRLKSANRRSNAVSIPPRLNVSASRAHKLTLTRGRFASSRSSARTGPIRNGHAVASPNLV